MTSWLILCLAVTLEVAGTTSMKLSEGFTKLIPSLAMGFFYAGSLALLTIALKRIDVSIAYAIWSGLGTALIAVIGFYWFKEPLTVLKIGSLALIIAGVVGLNLSGAAH